MDSRATAVVLLVGVTAVAALIGVCTPDTPVRPVTAQPGEVRCYGRRLAAVAWGGRLYLTDGESYYVAGSGAGVPAPPPPADVLHNAAAECRGGGRP